MMHADGTFEACIVAFKVGAIDGPFGETLGLILGILARISN